MFCLGVVLFGFLWFVFVVIRFFFVLYLFLICVWARPVGRARFMLCGFF